MAAEHSTTQHQQEQNSISKDSKTMRINERNKSEQ